MKTITILEMQLNALLHSTESINGCRSVLIAMDKLETYTKEEESMVAKAKDLVFKKGNNLIAKERIY